MKIQNAFTGLLSVGVLMGMGAGAAMAQTFSYTTIFTPNPVTTGTPGNFITITNGANSSINASGIGSAINLSNLTETSNVTPPTTASFTTPFNIALSITPIGGTTQTKNFTGTFSGQFNTDQSITVTNFNAPGALTYDFGSLGVYNVGNLSFVQPGPITSTTAGSIGAIVNFTRATTTVPEPATLVHAGGPWPLRLDCPQDPPDQRRSSLRSASLAFLVQSHCKWNSRNKGALKSAQGFRLGCS